MATAPLTYAQLEGVWIQAGGPKSLAPLMAAIAEAESGGRPGALNPTDNNGTQSSFGLWQISNGTHTPPSTNWADPLTNAKLAVAKYHSQGLGAWGTYTSGAYKQFLNSSTTPAPAPGGGTQTTAATQQQACIVPIPSVLGQGGGCLFSYGDARAIAGGLLLGAGGVVMFVGAAILVAAGFARTGALTKAAQVATGVGAAGAARGLTSAATRAKQIG